MYEVMLGGQSIGKAELHKEGGMWCIRCKCRLSGELPYQVRMICGDTQRCLGLLVPENGAFVLTARIPAKLLADAQPRFIAEPRRPNLRGNFVPIRADEPFAYLSSLEHAFMAIRDGKQGIVIPD